MYNLGWIIQIIIIIIIIIEKQYKIGYKPITD